MLQPALALRADTAPRPLRGPSSAAGFAASEVASSMRQWLRGLCALETTACGLPLLLCDAGPLWHRCSQARLLERRTKCQRRASAFEASGDWRLRPFGRSGQALRQLRCFAARASPADPQKGWSRLGLWPTMLVHPRFARPTPVGPQRLSASMPQPGRCLPLCSAIPMRSTGCLDTTCAASHLPRAAQPGRGGCPSRRHCLAPRRIAGLPSGKRPLDGRKTSQACRAQLSSECLPRRVEPRRRLKLMQPHFYRSSGAEVELHRPSPSWWL